MADPVRELYDDDEVPQSLYQPGDLGRIVTPSLQELIDHRADPADRQRLRNFLNWIPKDVLEGFLIRCLEFGADKTFPKPKTVRRAAKA